MIIIMKIINISNYSNEDISVQPLFIFGDKIFVLQHDSQNHKSDFGVYDTILKVYEKLSIKHEKYYPIFSRNGLVYLYLESSHNDYDIIGCAKIIEKDRIIEKITSFNIYKNNKYKGFDDICKVVKVFLPTKYLLFISKENIDDFDLLFFDINKSISYCFKSLSIFNSILLRLKHKVPKLTDLPVRELLDIMSMRI